MSGAPGWEYATMEIRGLRGDMLHVIGRAEALEASTSDGRYAESRVSDGLLQVVNEYGAEGWELLTPEVLSSASVDPVSRLGLVLRRPLVKDS
jgi:hypothetical protein